MRLDLNRILEVGIVIGSLAFVSFIAVAFYHRGEIHRLTLAAGSHTGESYILGEALRTVVERHNPRIKINLLETGGTVENLKKLEDGQAELAAAQADVLAGPSARVVAVLYDDTFQLLVPRSLPAKTFADLREKTISLPETGGQYQSFLRVAAHFGMRASDFRFTGATENSADAAFLGGGADAIFRVRALGNPFIRQLVQTGKVRMLPIEHALAMKINYPAFEPASIPAGAYSEDPAEPAVDLPSIAVHRTLLAAARVDDETVRAIAAALIDGREEMAREIPEPSAEVRLLLSHVRRPDLQGELGPALHPGALKFYEKDKPSFLLAHADYIALILTVFAMVTSWVWELRAWFKRQQKNVADEYSNRVIALIKLTRDAKTQVALDEIRGELLELLGAAVHDLDSDKVSEEAFQSFRAILQIGLDVVRDATSVSASPLP